MNQAPQTPSSAHAVEVFNLQLLINRLTEEVTLYRGGTDVPQLLDFIHEKDNEIKQLNKLLVNYEDKNHRLAQTRAEITSKYDHVTEENQSLKLERIKLTNECNNLHETVQAYENKIKDYEVSMHQQHYEMDKLSKYIAKLESDLEQRNDEVYQLQNKCAKLVKEKVEVTKLLDKERHDREKQVQEYRVSIIKIHIIIFVKVSQFFSHKLKNPFIITMTSKKS